MKSQQQSKQRFEVKGVPIAGWGDLDAFKRATGITFPLVGNPGLAIDTSAHPVTVLYNKHIAGTRVAVVGEVSYATLVEQAQRYATGEAMDNENSEGGNRV